MVLKQICRFFLIRLPVNQAMYFALSFLLAKKPELRMADPGGRPPGPEPGFRLF
jgi:hypothetical protein